MQIFTEQQSTEILELIDKKEYSHLLDLFLKEAYINLKELHQLHLEIQKSVPKFKLEKQNRDLIDLYEKLFEETFENNLNELKKRFIHLENLFEERNIPFKLIHLFFPRLLDSLISDLLNNIIPAIDLLDKKLIVPAISLLRRPIKGTLTILEQFIINPDEFSLDLMFENPTKYDPSNTSRKDIIDKVCKIINFDEGKVIYDYRYSYEKGFLSPIMDKALHIVTSNNRSSVKSSPGELNYTFIYSSEINLDQHLAHVAGMIVPIMIYIKLLLKYLRDSFLEMNCLDNSQIKL